MKSTLGNLAPVHKRFPFPGCIGPSQLCFTYPVPLLGIPHFVALDFKLPISGFDRYLSVLQEVSYEIFKYIYCKLFCTERKMFLVQVIEYC